ncbi:ABC transporter permease [Actinomadura violacea]|uniref:Transport permease protein n=1 Tax=Actinomadura violacea TaxID=2819934 RepID=A0ABS3RLG1_9ACTN|nr:ABC transporter permease [Actinomadura violacea]MBO2456924.1 ABC transporter permease [Actinomadura violacea]
MSANIATPPAASPGSALWRLSRAEFRLYLRDRVGPIWGVGFPLLLLIIFGNIPSFNHAKHVYGGLTELDIYVPVLVAFSLAILSLTALPSTLAGYREKGVLRRLETTPIGPARVLGAQLAVNLVTALVTLVVFLAVAKLAFDVVLPKQFGGFVLAWVLAAAQLMAIGLFIAAVTPTRSAAQAIGTVLFFPMMFFAGLWLPIEQMPSILRTISHDTPLGAAVRALKDASGGHFPPTASLLIMVGYAVVFGVAAARWFRWE